MNRVRELREDQLMPQYELAEKAGLSTRTVCKIERGESCSPTTKRKIVKALGVEIKHWRRVFPPEERH